MERKLLKKLLCASLAAAVMLGTGCTAAGAAELHGFTVGADGTTQTEETETPPQSSLPAAYSSRDLGYVTPVKAQDYSTCWAFASLATLESALLRQGYPAESMSTTHMILWMTAHADGSGWLREVSGDGFVFMVPGYMTSWQGGVFQSEVSDLTLWGDDTSDTIPLDKARYGVTSIRYMDKNHPDEIKQCIMDNGGVFGSFLSSQSCFADNRQYYYWPEGYSTSSIGHSVEFVGWDDNFPRENFNAVEGYLPEHNGAWLAKNSWGSSNPLGGYFWISYEDAHVFSKRFWPAAFAFTGFEQLDGSQKLIQNEIYGATYEFEYLNSNNLTYLNRLHFDGEYNAIDKVIFETTSRGAQYTVYYVPDGEDSAPDPDKSKWTQLDQGTVDYAGYYCADIDDFVYPEATGSIAVTIDASQTELFSTIGVDEWITRDDKLFFNNNSQYGQSYLMQDGNMQDLMAWYKENNDDERGATFVIKAVTVKKAVPTLLGDANLDGYVNINDVTEIQRHLAELIVLSDAAALNADYNQDGVITIDDATQIQKFLAEFIV